MDGASQRTSINMNTNIGHHMLLAILQLDGSQAKALIANEEANDLWIQGKYDIFLRGLLLGGSSETPTSNVFCGPDVDDNVESTKRRCIKWFVKTKISDNV
jgi:hypothetical protein